MKSEDREADSNPLSWDGDKLVDAVHVVGVLVREARRLEGALSGFGGLPGYGDVTVCAQRHTHAELRSVGR